MKEVIKFHYESSERDLAPFPGFEELNAGRQELRRLSLLGVDEDGIGFGNVSLRDGTSFYITGSGTGALPALTLRDYAKVVAWDFERNWLRCEGRVIASAESLTHAAASHDCGIDLRLIDAESLEHGVDGQLADVAGVLIPGGFGERGVEGKIRAAQFARENNVPYLGLCLGMQVATIEFARNVCGIAAANSSEFDQESAEPVICLLDEQRKIQKKGGSMRLGTWPTKIVHGTLAEKIYQHDEVLERHRHRYEFNMKYRAQMEKKGFLISGTSPDGSLAELVELRGHPFFLACQYHPEFQSKPNKPHPLFSGFIRACLAHQG